MSSVREHLSGFHSRAAEHHTAMHKTHSAIAAVHAGMKKAAAAGMADHHEALAGHHADLAELHKKHAEFHASAKEACSKATDTGDLNKLVPIPGLSRVTPDNPTLNRAVPRFGAPPLQRPPVPPEFQHVLGMSDLDDLG
jgi:hypothetical protein